MSAVFKHELRMYFQSMTAYVFGAFLLVAVGLGSMLYNLNAAISNFEYVFNYGALAFVVIIPILTMRVIAEERKQRTDQLLYALPITTAQVVLGKYLALLTVFLVPMCIVSIYPLIFAQFGDVYLLTSYGTILAFLFLGAALIAIGVFISSLSDSQGFAAGVGIAIILLNYFSVSLSEYVSSTAFGSAIAFVVLICCVWAIVNYMTDSEKLAYAVGLGLFALLWVAYFLNSGSFEGLLPEIMTALSLFDRFNVFITGVFDLTGIVFFVTVIVFFLFLSVQSMEKRRYN